MPFFKGLVYTLQIHHNNVVDFVSQLLWVTLGIFVSPVQLKVLILVDCRLEVWLLSN